MGEWCKMDSVVWKGFHDSRAYFTGGDVAATDQSRQLKRLGRPKNGLRSHQGDVAATNQSRRLGRPKNGLCSHQGDVQDVSMTSWRRL